MDKDLLKYLKYECEDIDNQIKLIEDEETLFGFICNYNWDDGFEIPSLVLKNKCCKLATALAVFYAAGGVEMLVDKQMMNGSSKWAKFVKGLYNQIVNGKYDKGKVGYTIPLSKVQKYKIGKVITAEEALFISNVEGVDARVIV